MLSQERLVCFVKDRQTETNVHRLHQNRPFQGLLLPVEACQPHYQVQCSVACSHKLLISQSNGSKSLQWGHWGHTITLLTRPFCYCIPPKKQHKYPDSDAHLARCLQPIWPKENKLPAKTDAFVGPCVCFEGLLQKHLIGLVNHMEYVPLSFVTSLILFRTCMKSGSSNKGRN